MHGEGFFFQAFVYLTAAVISVPVAKRLGLGSVLGYLVAGVAIGPFVLGLVGREGHDVMHFAEFGVVMMLFLVGLELQPARLWRLRAPILGLGGLQVGVTAAVIGAVGLAAGLPFRTSLAVGMILSLSSTAIVLQTLSEKGLLKTDAGQSAFAVLLFQDIAVIPMLAILPLLGAGGAGGEAHGTSWVEALPGWAQTLVVLAAVAGIVLAGRFLVRPMFRFIAGARLREIFTAAALLLVIGIALLMTRVGLSPALGTFLAGVVLADSEYRHELEGDIEPFKGLLLGLFFIAVGASIDFSLVLSRPGLVGGLVAALIAVKLVVLAALGRSFRMSLDQNMLFAFALAQGGEFAFVLFSFAGRHGVVAADVAAPLVAVVALSMALTPLLVLVDERLLQPRLGTREREERESDAIKHGVERGDAPVIMAGFGRFGSIVGRFLRATGVQATMLDHDSDHVDLLRRLGFKVFYGDASRLDLLHAAGAVRARLLIVAVDEPDKILDIVAVSRRHFPGLPIMARAISRGHAYELLDAGVDHVYRETLDSSLRLGVEALRMLGRRAHQVHRAARTFRRHDERSLRELARLRHDRASYFNLARQRIQELEDALESERAGPDDAIRDAGWDTTSLREEHDAQETDGTGG